MKMKIAVASMITFLALLFTSSACLLGIYQPREPKALRR